MTSVAFEFDEPVDDLRREVNSGIGAVISSDVICRKPRPDTIPPLRIGYRTEAGVTYWGKIESLLDSPRVEDYVGKVQLIFTSPPFPLNRKKRYGNKMGLRHLSWVG